VSQINESSDAYPSIFYDPTSFFENYNQFLQN
jgi:hypothetical protein